MDNIQLKNCPCCGYEAGIESWKARKGYEANAFCHDCGLSVLTTTFNTEEEAIQEAVNRWNKRAPIDEITNKLRELAKKNNNYQVDALIEHDWIRVNQFKGKYQLADELFKFITGEELEID